MKKQRLFQFFETRKDADEFATRMTLCQSRYLRHRHPVVVTEWKGDTSNASDANFVVWYTI